MHVPLYALSLLAAILHAPDESAPYYGLTPREPYGVYTDRPSYASGETISIHADWEIVAPATEVSVTYDLVRVGTGAHAATTTETFDTPQSEDLPYGSFADFPPAMTLEGRSAWTLEGWFRPTSVFDPAGKAPAGDWIAIAGEMQLGGPLGIDGVAGIGIDPQGVPFAMVKTDDGKVHMQRREDESGAGVPVEADVAWYYVGATFNGTKLRLFFAQEGTSLGPAWVLDLGGTFTTFVDPDPELTFRLGARKEAPGDETGCFDGRLDRWVVWDGVLTRSQLRTEMKRGESGPPVLAKPGDPPFPPRILDVQFEDAYDCTWDPTASYRCAVTDGSPNGYDGVVVNHGTPGLAGRPENGRALRLNHDQLVDAQWDVHATLTAPATSGMYHVEARDGTGALLGRCALVVRPTTPTPGADVALIVPVNTWTAYNPWPGSSFGTETATGLTVRFNGVKALRQGNNSTYQKMGDERSFAHYLGWRRPSSQADPGAGTSSVHAAMARKVFVWIHGLNARPTGTGICIDAGAPIVYDAYTDWDLHSGNLDLSDYPVVMTMAHHEYWSEAMLDALVEDIQMGGHAINVGGNLFAYRSELSTDAGGQVSGIVEVKKWPTHGRSLGRHDGISAIGGGRTGGWRYVEQCRTAEADPPPTFPYTRDYVLGTLIHMVAPCSSPDVSECWGTWAVRANAHPLWAGEVGFGDRLGVDTVGHEADVFLEEPPVACVGGTQYVTFEEWGTDVRILAEGTDFTPGAPPGVIDYDHASYCEDCDGLDAAAKLGGNASYWMSRTSAVSGPAAKSGHIVYYEGNFGQKVLNIASTAAPGALLGPANAPISNLVERALCCMARSSGCPPPPER